MDRSAPSSSSSPAASSARRGLFADNEPFSRGWLQTGGSHSLQQFVTFYRVDPSSDGGKGDWVIEKQQDYGPAP